jgi:hypothetical protein
MVVVSLALMGGVEWLRSRGANRAANSPTSAVR